MGPVGAQALVLLRASTSLCKKIWEKQNTIPFLVLGFWKKRESALPGRTWRVRVKVQHMLQRGEEAREWREGDDGWRL